MLPCRWAIRSDHYFEAQTGCLDTGLGDELSRRAGSVSAGRSCCLPLILTSRLGLLCCFPRCSGWLKCLADRPLLKNISIHGFRPVKDEELHFDTESRLKGGVSVWVLSAAARRPGEKKDREKGWGRKGEKGPPYSSLSHSEFLNIRQSA